MSEMTSEQCAQKRENNKRWAMENKDKVKKIAFKAYKKAYKANPEKYRQKAKVAKLKNPEYFKTYNKVYLPKWHLEHPNYNKEYQITHAEELRQKRKEKRKLLTSSKLCAHCKKEFLAPPGKTLCSKECKFAFQSNLSIARIVNRTSSAKISNTDIELIVQRELKSRGFKVVNWKGKNGIYAPEEMVLQFPWYGRSDILRFSLDIALPFYKLLIECNGSYWHREPGSIYENYLIVKQQQWAMAADTRKKAYFIKTDWKLFQLWESVIKRDIKTCINEVLNGKIMVP